MPTRDDYWRLGGTVIGPRVGSEKTRMLGEQATLDVWLTSESDSPAGAWPNHVKRYRTLRHYEAFAGDFALHDLSSGRIAFTETHSAADEIPNGTLLVALRPPVDSVTGQGGWFLAENVEDATTLPKTLCQLTFEMTFVAELEWYPDRQDALDDLRAPI